MITICVLSNSHAASLKAAWDEKVSEMFPDVSMTFFAARNRRMDGLQVEGNALVASEPELTRFLEHTSGGRSRIVPADFNIMFVYGLDFRLQPVGTSFSAAVRRQCVVDAWRETLSSRIVQRVRQACGSVPVYVGHDPQPTPPLKPDAGRLDYASLCAGLEKEPDLFGGVFVRQPQETLHGGWWTGLEFSRGSERLDIGKGRELHPESDRFHMNSAFGEVYLQHFLGHVLGSGRSPRRAP